MRACLLFDDVGASAGSVYSARLLSSTFRDVYLRVEWNGSAYVVDVYATRLDAQGEQSRLATATHAAGNNVEVTFSAVGGAPFTITPLKAYVTAGGTWTYRIVGWIAGVQAALVSRIEAILARYGETDEVLDGIEFAGIGRTLPAKLPAYGLVPTRFSIEPLDTDTFRARASMQLWAAFEGVDEATTVRATEAAEVLRSIALDEQRTWGGWAANTVAAGDITPTVDADGGHVVFIADVPIVIDIVDLMSERGPNGETPGHGGKYAVGL